MNKEVATPNDQILKLRLWRQVCENRLSQGQGYKIHTVKDLRKS